MTDVNIMIDADLHKQAKIHSVKRGITLTSFYKDALQKKIEEDLKLLEGLL